MDKVLNLLGIAKKAQKLILGSDSIINAFPHKKIKIIFLASDASALTKDKFDKKAYFYKVKVINKYSSIELSKALGVTQIKIVGVTDDGFASAIMKEIERG